MKLRVGTRGSDLARSQTGWVVEKLKRAHRDLAVEVVLIKTSGDQIRDVPLAQVGGKGLFVKEIEAALLAGEIDCAVHSMKDLPGEIPPELVVAAVPQREDPRDVVVTKEAGMWPDAMQGTRVGTCSPRRAALLMSLGLGIEIVPLRGNVGTRLAKVDRGEVDATLLAAAGLNRLALTPANTHPLDPMTMVPAVGQGCLAVEARRGEYAAILTSIEDRDSRIAADAERAFLTRMGGNCVSPLAAYARIVEGQLSAEAVIAGPTGTPVLREADGGLLCDAAEIGTRLAERLLERGGADILRALDCHA